MKKSSALFLLFSFVLRLPAQLPQGSPAPDFIAADINGQPWHLYQLLEQGKIVVLEFSTTWCPPCWAYHNSHALQNFYTAHGPEGDSTVQVLFIESDAETDVECLYGQADCNDFTPGNWIEGTTYPYIDNSVIADSFQVTYFPTIFIVCPNKKVYQVGQLDAESLWQKTLDCPVASGTNNVGIFDFDPGTGLREICGELTVKPSFSLINLGTASLTAATVTLQWNTNLEQTKQWYGNLPLYGETTVVFDSLHLNGVGILKTTITNINNGAGDDDFSNNVHNDNFAAAQQFITPQIILKIKTDNYGLETYWELRDAKDSVLYHGGNANVGPDGGGIYGNLQPGPGAYGDNVLITKNLALPGDGCYSILFVDAYGDGMCCGYGNGYYKLYNGNNPALPILTGGEFDETEHRGFSVKSTTGTFETGPDPMSLRLFPNPAHDRLNFEFAFAESFTVSATVANALGQTVHVFALELLAPGEHLWALSVEGWPEGVYFTHVQVGECEMVQKFLVGK